MSLRRRRLLLLPAALAFACVTARGSGDAPAATGVRSIEPVSADLAVRTLDSAWSIIGRSYYDTTMRGIDWLGVREKYRPRAAAAGSLGELRTVVREMLGELGESHFVLIPQEAADALDPAALRDAKDDSERPGDAGLEARLIGDDVVVSDVVAGGPADRAGVRPGWIVDSVGMYGEDWRRRTIERLTSDRERAELELRVPHMVMAMFRGTPGDSVSAWFRDGQGRIVTRTLTLAPTAGEPVRFGNLPTQMTRLTHERRPLPDGVPNECVGVIHFNIWMVPIAARFDRALDEVRDCRGIVLDLRGNPGGVAGMVMGVGGHFLDSATSLGTMRTRQGELRFSVNPRLADSRGQPVRPYAGALAILTDELSVSTSEIFAAGMQSVGRARVFGDTTARQALPALMSRLPNDDVLMHVFADFTDPRGQRVEGRGAVPDVVVPLTRRDLLAGRDAALEAALQWIASQPVP